MDEVGLRGSRNHAWAGDRTVEAVHLPIDFGATWFQASLDPPVNPHAWQDWRAEVEFLQSG